MPDIRNLKNVLYKTLEYTTNIESNKCVLFSANDAYKIGCYLSTPDFSFYFEVDNNGVYKITNAKCNTTGKSVSIYFENTNNMNRYYAELNSGIFGYTTTRKEIFYGIMNAELTAATTEVLENPVVTIDFSTEEILGSYKISDNAEVLDINVQRNVVVGGNASVSQNLTVSGSTSIAQDLTVSGEATLNGITNVISTATLNTLNVTGSTIASNVNSCTTLTLNENTLVNGEAELNVLNVTDNTIAKDIIANASTTFETTVNVSGNADLNRLTVNNQSTFNNLNVEGLLKSKETVFLNKTVWVDDLNNIVETADLTEAEVNYLNGLEESENLREITENIDSADPTNNRRHLKEVNTFTPTFDVSGNTYLNNLAVNTNTTINDLNIEGTLDQTSSNNTVTVTGNIGINNIESINTANINNLNIEGTLDQTSSNNTVTVTGDIIAVDANINSASINDFISAGEVYANKVTSKGEMTIDNDTIVQNIVYVDNESDIEAIKENLGKVFVKNTTPINDVYKVVSDGTSFTVQQLAGVINNENEFKTTDLLVAKYNNKYYDVEKYNKLTLENHDSLEPAVLSTENAEKAIKKLLRNNLYRLDASSLIAKNVRFADLLTVYGTTIIADGEDYGNIYFGDTDVAVRGVTVEAYGQISVPDDYRQFTSNNDDYVIQKAGHTIENGIEVPTLNEVTVEYDKESLKTILKTVTDRIKLNTSVLGRTIKFADGIISIINKEVTENDTTSIVKQLNVRNKSKILLAIYEDSTSLFTNNMDLYDQYCNPELNLKSNKFNDLTGYSFDDVLAHNIELIDDVEDGSDDIKGKYLYLPYRKDGKSKYIYPSLLVYVDEDNNHDFHIHVQQTRTNGNDHTYLELDNDAYDFVSETWGLNQLNLGTNFLNDKHNNLYMLIPSPAVVESYDTIITEDYLDEHNETQTREVHVNNYVLQNSISLYATSLEASDDYLVTAKALYGILNNGATSTTPFASNILKQGTNNNLLYQQNPTSTKYVDSPDGALHANLSNNNYILTQEGAKVPNFTYKVVNNSYLNDNTDDTGKHHNKNGDLLSYTDKDDYKKTIPTIDYLNKLLELGYTTYFGEEKGYVVHIDNLYEEKSIDENDVETVTNSGYIIQFANPNDTTSDHPVFEENPHGRSIYKYTAPANANTHEIKKVLVSYNPKKYDYILPGDYIIVNEDLNYSYIDGLCSRYYENNAALYAAEGTQKFDATIKYNVTILHNNSIENGRVVYVSNTKVSGNATNVSDDATSYNIPLFNYNKKYKEKNDNTNSGKEFNYEVHNSDIKVKQDTINGNSLTLTGLTAIENLTNVKTSGINVNNIKPIDTSINVGDNNTILDITTNTTSVVAANTLTLANNSSQVAITLNTTGISINSGINGIKIKDNDPRVILHNITDGELNGDTQVWVNGINDLNISTNNTNITTANININSNALSETNIAVNDVNLITASNSTLRFKNIDKELQVSQYVHEYIAIDNNEVYSSNRTYKVLKDVITRENNIIYKENNIDNTLVIDSAEAFNNYKSRIVKLKESALTDTGLYTTNIEGYNLDISNNANIKNIINTSISTNNATITNASVGVANVGDLTVTNTTNLSTALVDRFINVNDNSKIEITNGNLNITNGTNGESTTVFAINANTKNISVDSDIVSVSTNHASINVSDGFTINSFANINTNANIVLNKNKSITIDDSNVVISSNGVNTHTLTVSQITTNNANNQITVDSGKKLIANISATIINGESKFKYNINDDIPEINNVTLNASHPIVFIDEINNNAVGEIKSGVLKNIDGLNSITNGNNRLLLSEDQTNNIKIESNNSVLIGNSLNGNYVSITGGDINANTVTAKNLNIINDNVNMLNIEERNLSTYDRIIELGKTTSSMNNTVYDTYISASDAGKDLSYIGFYAKQLDGKSQTALLEFLNDSSSYVDENILNKVLLKKIDYLEASDDQTILGKINKNTPLDVNNYDYYYGYSYSSTNNMFLPNISIYKINKLDENKPKIIKTLNNNTPIFVFKDSSNSSILSNTIIIHTLTDKQYLVKGLFIGDDGYWKVGRAIVSDKNQIDASSSGSMLQDILTRTKYTGNGDFVHNVDINHESVNDGLLMAYNPNTKRMEGANFDWNGALTISHGKIRTHLAGDASSNNNNYFGVAKIDSTTSVLINGVETKPYNGLNINDGVISMSLATNADNTGNTYGTVRVETHSTDVVTTTDGQGVTSTTNKNYYNGLTINNGIIGINRATATGASGETFGVVKVSEGNGLYISKSTDDDKQTVPGIIRLDVATSINPGAVKITTGNGLIYNTSNGSVGLDISQFVTQTNGISVSGCIGTQNIELALATSESAGSVIVDTSSETGLTISSGLLGIKPATTQQYGTVKIDTTTGTSCGLKIDNTGLLGVSLASTKNFGTVKIDTTTGTSCGLKIDSDGILGVSLASTENFGTIKVSQANGLSVSEGLISMAKAGTGENDFGTVKIGNGINVENGVISTAVDGSNIVFNGNTITLSSNINIDGITVTTFSANTITADQYYVNSDKRLKNISKELDYSATEILDKIKTYSFTYKNDPMSTKHIGVMAQDLKDIDLDGFSFVNVKEDGFYEIKETKLIYLLIKAVQEQKEEIEKLKKQINLGEQ